MMPVGSPRSAKGPMPSPKGSLPKLSACASSIFRGALASLSRAKRIASCSLRESSPREAGDRCCHCPAGGKYMAPVLVGRVLGSRGLPRRVLSEIHIAEMTEDDHIRRVVKH